MFLSPEQDLILLNKKLICKKLDSIRILRNYISHHKQIIGCNLYEGQNYQFKLIDTYNNIIEILNIIGYEDIDYIIGDLHCLGNKTTNCSGNSFKALYKQFEFIHNKEIKVI